MKQTVNTFMRNRDCVLNHLPIAKAKVRVIEKYGLSGAIPELIKSKLLSLSGTSEKLLRGDCVIHELLAESLRTSVEKQPRDQPIDWRKQ